jgi:hypothetical protein
MTYKAARSTVIAVVGVTVLIIGMVMIEKSRRPGRESPQQGIRRLKKGAGDPAPLQ